MSKPIGLRNKEKKIFNRYAAKYGSRFLSSSNGHGSISKKRGSIVNTHASFYNWSIIKGVNEWTLN
jgi:hypothetical protein